MEGRERSARAGEGIESVAGAGARARAQDPGTHERGVVMSDLRRTSRTRTPRSRFTITLGVGVLIAVFAVGALAAVGKSTLIGKLEGPEVVTDPAKFPKKF